MKEAEARRRVRPIHSLKLTHSAVANNVQLNRYQWVRTGFRSHLQHYHSSIRRPLHPVSHHYRPHNIHNDRIRPEHHEVEEEELHGVECLGGEVSINIRVKDLMMALGPVEELRKGVGEVDIGQGAKRLEGEDGQKWPRVIGARQTFE